MPTLQDLGERFILPRLQDKTCKGASLVVPGQHLAPELAAWAIDTCMGDLSPESDDEEDFCALYATTRAAMFQTIERKVKLRLKLRRRRGEDLRGTRDGILSPTPRQKLPTLLSVNYATIRVVRQVAAQFPANSLDLLVL